MENKYWHEKDDFDSNDDEDFCLNDGSKFEKFENLFEGIDKFKVYQYKTYLKQKFWNLHRGIMDFSELTIFKSDCEATKTFYKDIYRLSGLNVILINHTLQVKFTGLLIIFVIGKWGETNKNLYVLPIICLALSYQ